MITQSPLAFPSKIWAVIGAGVCGADNRRARLPKIDLLREDFERAANLGELKTLVGRRVEVELALADVSPSRIVPTDQPAAPCRFSSRTQEFDSVLLQDRTSSPSARRPADGTPVSREKVRLPRASTGPATFSSLMGLRIPAAGASMNSRSIANCSAASDSSCTRNPPRPLRNDKCRWSRLRWCGHVSPARLESRRGHYDRRPGHKRFPVDKETTPARSKWRSTPFARWAAHFRPVTVMSRRFVAERCVISTSSRSIEPRGRKSAQTCWTFGLRAANSGSSSGTS